MTDAELFGWADQGGYTIVTDNVKDFRPLATASEASGGTHPVLLFTSSRRSLDSGATLASSSSLSTCGSPAGRAAPRSGCGRPEAGAAPRSVPAAAGEVRVGAVGHEGETPGAEQ